MADVGGSLKFNGPAALDPTVAADGTIVDKRLAVGSVFDQMDGHRVRYDTPKFAGFNLGLSAGEKDMADAELQGALAWADPGSGKNYSQIDGSLSALFDFGLNLTVASSSRSMDNLPAGGGDPVYTYGKLLPQISFTAVTVFTKTSRTRKALPTVSSWYRPWPTGAPSCLRRIATLGWTTTPAQTTKTSRS